LTSIEAGCNVKFAYNGSSRVLSHPKVYSAKAAERANIVLGSANLTVGGLNSNSEASLRLALDLNTDDDTVFAEDLKSKIEKRLQDFKRVRFSTPKKAGARRPKGIVGWI